MPIGDVTLCRDDMPIVIGEKACRGQGIGGKVVAALVRRAEQLGWKTVRVREIYAYNVGSRRCFARAGFCAYQKTDKGDRWRLELG